MDDCAQAVLAEVARALEAGEPVVHVLEFASERDVLEQQAHVDEEQDQRCEQKKRRLGNLDL
jgi:hypothetical protein